MAESTTTTSTVAPTTTTSTTEVPSTTTTTEAPSTTTTTTEVETTTTTTVEKQGEVAVDKGADAEVLQDADLEQNIEDAKQEGLRNHAAEHASDED